RCLRASGYRVTYVRNITDIDDKIIKRAAENNEPVDAVTARFIQAMDEDADKLGVEKPDQEPRATHYVREMQDMIRRLQEKQFAYQSASGDVNYAVRRFPGYGKLSGKSLDELRAGVRVVLKHYDPEVVRFLLLRSHYRSPLNYTDANLDDAKQALTRLYTALRDHPAATRPADWAEPHAKRFKAAMDDDFGTPEALAE